MRAPAALIMGRVDTHIGTVPERASLRISVCRGKNLRIAVVKQT